MVARTATSAHDTPFPVWRLCDYLDLGIFAVDQNLRVLVWNRWLADKTGVPPEEALGKPLLQVLPGLQNETRMKYLRRALAGEAQVLSHRFHRYLIPLLTEVPGEGTREMLQTTRILPLQQDGLVQGAVVIIEDVTERYSREEELLRLVSELKRSEEQIAAKERRFRSVFESTSDALVVLSLDGLVELANPSAAGLLEIAPAELLGTNFLDFVSPEHKGVLSKALARACTNETSSGPFEARFKTTQGREILLEISVRPLVNLGEGASALFQGRDITVQRQMEQALRRAEQRFWAAQKSEAITLLAGGVAHDFNNMLSIILGFAELTLQAMAEDDPNRSNLEEIRQAALRASEVTGELLTFTGRRPTQRTLVDVGPVVSEAIRLFRRSVPENVKLTQDLLTAPTLVFADAGQIKQVVVNLCANALAAVERQQDGQISVILRRVTVDDNEARLHETAPGEYVVLAVVDNAQPLSEESRGRLFDPYYDPHRRGRGRNLGLAATLGIVRSHQGFVTVTSSQAKGNTVSVYLPLSEEVPVESSGSGETPTQSHGHETILVVDDEPAFTKLQQELLGGLGYEVLTANSAREALCLIDEGSRHFDLALIDVSMPEMTGDDLARKIRERDPSVAIILCTGYSDQVISGKPGELSADAYLIKPVEASALARVVQETLRHKRHASQRPDLRTG
ncbi:MAG: PAS domain-containing protein [Thermoleophilia bacterium]|nr:PAS domain-containing protein [Thermoleophilia bacterium]